MKKILSRYRPRYIRSLVYMLQSTEYMPKEYYRWYFRTKDFSQVEKRKKLVITSKSVSMTVLAWLMLGIFLGAIFLLSSNLEGYSRYFVLILGILCAPYILGMLIVVPLIAGQFLLQKPAEYFILKSTRQKISGHKALKIAIAGSYGKTTMREIVKTVLQEGVNVAAPPKSFNTPLGISKFVKSLSGDEDVIVFEFGEYYPGDITKLCKLVDPDMGIITGVNEAHLSKFKTIETTAKTIFELSDWLGDKTVYVNGEDSLASKNAKKDHVIYSRRGGGRWIIENPLTNLESTRFTLKSGKTEIKIVSGLLGFHHLGPMAAAASIASSLNLTSQQIQAGLNRTKAFAHRLEPKTDQSGVTTLDDSYNGNPDGVKAVIEFLAGLKGRRRIYVTPGLVEMGAKVKEVHENIGEQLAQAQIEKVVLIKNSVTPYIAKGLEDAAYSGEILWFDSAEDTFKALPQITVAGDVVLLQNDWTDQYA